MRITNVVQYLKQEYPELRVYNGSIDKGQTQAIGVFARGGGSSPVAIGGVQNSSYAILPVTLLVHWTENADTAEAMAFSLFNNLFGKSDLTMDGIRVFSIHVLDPHPIFVDRDDKNIAEFVIRLNIVYEREVV